jgi:hypothetical protein
MEMAMRWTSAAIAIALAGPATFANAQAPGGSADPDWRQQMIARGSSTVSVDQALANLTRNLSLTPEQVAGIGPILQQHHDRILNILKSAPASLTRDEFMAQVHRISAETHDRINALLTPKQLELVKQLGTPARI